MRRTLSRLGLLALAWTAMAAPVLAGHVTYSAVDDFANPQTAPWSYGYATAPGGFDAFTQFDSTYLGVSGLAAWYTDVPTPDHELPAVIRNTTTGALTYATVNHPQSLLNLHPSVGSSQPYYAIVRFTAPSSGLYDVSAVFQGLDATGPTTTTVHVHVSSGAIGTSLFAGSINGAGPGSAAAYASTLPLLAGNTLDFLVGPNGTANNGFHYDSTGFEASITAVPDGGVPSLIGLAVGMLGALFRRR